MKNYDDSILLINKDTDFMSNFSIILGDYGYNLRVALDSQSAIEMIRQKKIDLILIDFSFTEISPYRLFEEIIKLKPEIPRIIIVTKEILDDVNFNKMYPYLYDIVIKPVIDINDFRMRIRRGIENTKLLKENREYQKIMIEKTFRIGMLDILSSILHQVNNDVDRLLASLYLWKEECSSNFKNEDYSKKFNENFNDFKEKILTIEEKIQLNEVLLSEHISEKGIMIDSIIKDILETLKDTLISANIDVTATYNEIKPTKLDSMKIVQCFFHIIENSISYLKHSQIKREIRITCRNFVGENREEFIETVIFDNSDSKEIEERLKGFEKDYHNDSKEKRFGLFDIKKYIDSINGYIGIKPGTNENNQGIRTIICFPVI
jgi:CheY-like chemotaxis protein